MRSLFSFSLNLLHRMTIGAFLITIPSTLIQPALAKTAPFPTKTGKYIKFNEWMYLPEANPPVLMWWNEKMSDTVPTLYIFFTPEKIVLNAVTPLWPDTGILFYIRDETEKQGINLTLNHKDANHCYYSATLDTSNRQAFVNNLVTSRKARLITPSSYSQSLSLKHVDQAMQLLLASHPEIHLTIPKKE